MRTHQNKKQVRAANIYLKKSCKVISALVVFILLSTVFSSVVSSQTIINSNEEKTDGPIVQLLKNRLSERLSMLKEKIQNLRDKLSDIANGKIDAKDTNAKTYGALSRTNFVNSVSAFFYTLKASSTLMFYTSYNGIEKRTELRLFREIKVDVNGDNKEDISVKITLYPKIERPLALSINFNLVIKRLPDFPDENPPSKQESPSFQAYVELYFPGLLIAKQKGDFVRFGYESALDQVPENCVVTYKYMPHLLSTKRPEHRVTINPVEVDDAASNLILLFSYTNMDGENLTSQLVSRVSYAPAVKSTLYIGGEGILGGNTYEFSRELSDKSTVNMTCSFQKNNTNIIGYVNDMPKKINFSADFGREGFLEFNTYGEHPSEIGICNNLTDPTGVNTSRVYFTNVPTLARLDWNRKLLDEKKANVTFYTQGDGAALNGHLALSNNKTIDFKISSQKNLDSFMELDLAQNYLLLQRSEVDLNVSLSAKGSKDGTFDLSFDLERFYDKPFEIFFGGLNETTISLANQTYVINNFYLMIHLIRDSGPVDIGFKADKIVKEKSGNITIVISTAKDDGNFTFTVTMIVENGLYISGFQLCFNGAWTVAQDIVIEGTVTRTFEIFLQVSDFEYFVAEDRSWGYFFFRGSMSYDSYREFICNNITGGFKGRIYMQSGSEGLNISWYKVNESGQNVTKVNITGLNFGLSGFHFYYGDMINFSIPNFTGSIQIIETCRKSGHVLLDLQGSQSFLDINLSFNFSSTTNDSSFEFGVTFDDFHIDHLERSLSLELAWNEKNISMFRLNAETNINFSVDKLDIRLASKGAEIFKLENLTGHAIGYAGLDINLTMPLKVNTTDGWYFDLANDTLLSVNLTNVDVYLYIQNLSALQLGKIVIDADVTGTAKFSILNFSKEIYNVTVYDEPINVSLLNFTIGIDAQEGLLDLRFFEIENVGTLLAFVGIPIPFPMPVILENISIHGYSDITISIKMMDMVGLCGADILIENKADTEIYIEKAFVGLSIFNLNVGAFIGNLSMTEGIVYLIFDFAIKPAFAPVHLNLKIPEANALKSFEAGVEVYPDLAKVVMSVDPPLDYFNVELNMGIDTDESYVLIDTKNTTATADFYSILTAEFINLGIDWWNSHINLTLPHVQDDSGIWIDNVTLKADEFYVYLNSSNPRISGYLNITGSGNIYRLVNGEWVPLIPGGNGFSFVIVPGHIQIKFDMAVEDFPVYLHEEFENGDEVTLAANFTVISDNLTIDIWWNLSDGHIRIDLSRDAGREFSIEDFLYEIKRNHTTKMRIAFSSLSFRSGNATFFIDSLSKELTLELSGSLITWDGFDSEFVKVPLKNIGNSTINLSWDHFNLIDGNIVFQTVLGSNEYTWNIESDRYIDWFEWAGLNGSIEGIDNPNLHFEAGVGLIKWNKTANNFFSLNISKLTNGSSIRFDRYADVDSTLVVEDAYIRYITPNLKIPIGTRLRSFTAEYQRKSHEYLYLEYIRGEYINLTADIAATWNISFERFFDIMNALSKIDFVSGLVDVNLSMHYEPPSDNFTTNHLDLNVLDTSSIELIEIVNYYALRPDKILSIGSLQLEPGQISIDWLINSDKDAGWMFFNNTGVTIQFAGLTLKKGVKEITILNATKEPGQLYLDFNLSGDESRLYINNTATAYFVLLNISKGFDFIGIGKDTEIGIVQMKAGEFNARWKNVSGEGGDYDKQYIINNGVFEFTTFKITRKIGNLEFFVSGRNTSRNYQNTITLKYRDRGDKNRALFVDTTSYIELERWSVGVSTSQWNLQLNLFRIKWDFNDWYIGYFDGSFKHGGRLRPVGIKFVNISFSFKDQNQAQQEIFTQYCEEYNNLPQTSAFVLDSTNCTEDLTIDFINFEAGTDNNKVILDGQITIEPQRHLIVHFDANPAPHDGVIDGHVFVDTNNQAMGDLSIEAKIYVESLNVYVGLGVGIQVLKADDFYIYGAFTQTWWGWIPSSWELSGTIDVFSGSLYFIYGDRETEIWPCIPKAVLDKQVYGVSLQHPVVNFDTSQSSGYIFPLTKMRWDWNGDGVWDNWINYETSVTHDFSDFLNSGQSSVQVGFQVKTIARLSEITTATITRGNDLGIEIVYTGDVLYEEDPFEVHVTDYDTGNPISNALVTYHQEDIYGNIAEATNSTNASGVAGFIAFSVPPNYYVQTSDAIAYAEKDGYLDSQSGSFQVHDKLADISGFARNLVTHERIGGAKVEAQPGDFVTYSPPQNVNSPFRLFVPEGTYDLTISKSGYESITIENVAVEQGGYYFLGYIGLPPMDYGGLRGTVSDSINGEKLWGVTVSVNGIVTKTDVFGVFPDNYPSPLDQYYSIDLLPGNYTVDFTFANYSSYEKDVTIVAGQITQMQVDLEPFWISPTGYSDPSSDWNNEINAYDNNTGTRAISTALGPLQWWQWSGYLELTRPAVNCDKIRFYAWYHQNYCSKIDVEVYYSGSWHEVYEGSFTDSTWVEKSLDGTYSVTKARVRFWYKGSLTGTTADLYEFDFHRVIQSRQ